MPRYLALDYAYEAIKEHQNFLSVFLLALPSSLEYFGQYGLTGSNDDYNYRSPWLQVKGKGTLRSLSNCDGLQETLRQIVPSASPQGLESISEAVIYVIPSEDDIVPSSNPDSPPLDSQTKQSILQIQSELQLIDPSSQVPSSIGGQCVKEEEEEDDFDGDGSGKEYARFMLENLFEITLQSRRHQTCEEMCKQLVPKTIKDPFSNLPPDQRTEALQLRDNVEESITTGPSTELSKDAEIFPDVWKDQETCKHEDLLLPELVSSLDTIQCAHPSVGEEVPDQCQRLEQEGYTDQFDWSEGGFLKSVPSGSIGLHQEQLPQMTEKSGDPVLLNCEGLALLDPKEESSDLDQGCLEPPRTPIDASKSTSKSNTGKEHPKLPMTPISCFDAEIVTPKTKEKAENRMWKTEQHLHEAVALSLKVPEIPSNKMPSPPLSPKSQLGLTKDHGNSDVDLLVPWQPVNVPQIMKNEKVTRSVEELEGAERTKMLDSDVHVDCNQEPVIKEEISIDGDECDEPLEALEIELEVAVQKTISHCSESQRQESDERSSTAPKTQMCIEEKPQCGSSKERKEDVVPKRPSPPEDPLMDFLKLRCKESLIRKEKSVPIKQPPLPPPHLPIPDKKETEERSAKQENAASEPLKPITIKKEVICDDVNESELTPVKSGNKKPKSRVVEVTLTPPFLEMVTVIEDALAPLVSHLHSSNALSPSYTLRTLTTDVTRFLLLQHEKQYTSSTGKDDAESYKHIIVLHSYVTAIDLMVNCDAVSAIMHLALTNERYKDTISGGLDTVRNTLFKKHCLLPKHTLHPKLQEMARITGEWFQKKLKKEGRDHDPKVLVIIRRENTKLAENVTSVLLSVKGLSASTLCSTPQTTYVAVSEALDKHNCLVITPTQIDESFPWAHFSLVIEYEASPKSPWRELCLRQKIRHIELRCIGPASSGGNLGHPSTSDGGVNEKKDDDKPKTIPLKLIGSENIINSSKLLHMLETRYNILIVERTTASPHGSSLTRPAYADLILDERTGVVIIELESLLGEGTVEPLVHRITLLSQQFCRLWVILEGNGQSNRYALGGHVVVNTCKLQAALSQFTTKSHDFAVKVMYSCDSISTASTIEMISDVTRQSSVAVWHHDDWLTRTWLTDRISKVMYSCDSISTASTIEIISNVTRQASAAVWHHDDWLTRPWLTDRLSKHEKFLTGFPCVNSFSAQVMLTAAPLSVLLSAPFTYLTKLCPWIPTRIISSFYKLVHDESPFSDRPSKAGMSQRIEESRPDQAEPIPRERSVIDQRDLRAIADVEATDGKGKSHGRVDGHDIGSSDLYHRQEHGRTDKWSMLQRERVSMSQDRSRHHDIPVTIKSEPVDDCPVYDLADSESFPPESYVPDDMKTPLQLLASSDLTRNNQSGLSGYHAEKFDAEVAMGNNMNRHPTRDVLHHFDKGRSNRRDLYNLLSSSSSFAAKLGPTAMPAREWTVDEATLPTRQSGTRADAKHAYSVAKPGPTTMPAREWTVDEATLPTHQSGTRAGARHAYSGLENTGLPSQYMQCQEWDLEQRLTNKQVESDYSHLEQIQFPGQSSSVSASRRNTRPHEMEPLPYTSQNGAPRKYIGIAQPCPRAATNSVLKKTIPRGSSSSKASRSGEFGTLATSGLPARRGSSSTQNQSQGYFPGQMHHQDYCSQQDQHHGERPPDHQQSQPQQPLHSSRDAHWGGGGDATMLSRTDWLQGQASSYRYQRGKLNSLEDLYTDGLSKRRRLTYERIPGSKGGQTKLTFR